MARKLLHVSMIVDASIIHELLMLITGKAIGAPEIKPVNHGGAEPNGALRDRPSTREIILALANSRDSFTSKEVSAEGEKFGHQKAAMYAALGALCEKGVLKRVAPATYSGTGKAAPAAGFAGRPKREKKMPGGIPGKILEAMRELQNGSGEGVALNAIKTAIGKKHTDSISPQMTTLVRRGFLKRVGDASYRVA
jgi:hypothetical protein